MIFAGEFELERGVVLRRRLGRTRSQASVRNCVCTQLVCLHAGFAWNRRCFFFSKVTAASSSHQRSVLKWYIITHLAFVIGILNATRRITTVYSVNEESRKRFNCACI